MSIDASSGMVKLLNKAIATEAAARKALAVLRDVEWPGDVAHTVTGPYVTCSMCERWRKNGHAEDCALAEAIKELEEAL